MNGTQANADDLLAAALQQLQEGDLAGTETLARQLVAIDRRHVPGWTALGVSLQLAGRYGEAESAFLTLIELEPTERAHWVNLGTARRADRRPDEALGAFARAAELGEASADFFYNVGLAHIERRDFESAQAVLGRARQLAPRDADIGVAAARAAYEALQTEAAVAILADWSQFDAPTTETLAEIAFLLMNLGRASEAESALSRALADPAGSPEAGLTLVKVLERTNRIDDAIVLLDRVRHDPRSKDVQRDLRLAEAQLAQRGGEHERATVLFRQTLAEPGPFEARHYQLFPLARSLDALGRHDDAWEALREAHASQVADLEQVSPLLAIRGAPTMEITRYGCAAADVAQWTDRDAPTVDESPIFIVAFPRSGTTLLELTLDAHPDLVSMDEQPFLQNALDDLLALGLGYPDALAPMDTRQLQLVRAKYWDRTLSKVRLEGAQRLVDKNPLNLLRLPVIRRLFPNAPVIMAIRHPCDVLMSCYMQQFRAPDFALLCRDLPTLALGYRRAFEFWYTQTAILQPNSREIRYEQFVAAFEPEVRALAQFLQVEWRDQMLDSAGHAQRKGFISTPSYSQVVQPVNTRSIGRWHRHERHFAPVLPALAPLLARWGYDGADSVVSNSR